MPPPHLRGGFVRLVSYLLAGAILLVAIIALGKELAHHLHAFEIWIGGLGPWALVTYVVVYVLLNSLFVPDTLLGIIAGATFGFVEAVMLVVAGTLLGASLQFALARHLLKPTIDRLLAARPLLAATQAAVLREELRLQFLIRLTPLNRALTSYILGAAGVRYTGFVLACGALLPYLCLEIYFGYAGKHLAQVATATTHTAALHDTALLAGLVVTFVVMALVSRTARRAVESAIAQVPPAEGAAR